MAPRWFYVYVDRYGLRSYVGKVQATTAEIRAAFPGCRIELLGSGVGIASVTRRP